MSFEADLKNKKEYVESILERFTSERGSVTDEACSYSVGAGGKRLRPVFLLSFYELFNENADDKACLEVAESFAAALEFIHTYSLVHDDLPDMDNDLLRRGKPTTHAKYGAAMGILCGDALLNEAFVIIAGALNKAAFFNDGGKCLVRAAKAFKIMAECAGRKGMILGQEIDVLNEGKSLGKEKLLKMYELKTSKLLVAAFCAGAALGGANDEELALCEKAAVNLGIAFQIRDDILDVTGNEAKLGKPVNSDEKNDKRTYVFEAGLEKAGSDSKEFTKEAIGAIKALNRNSGFIESLMNMLLERES